jgi:hypothetical protein
VIHFSRLKLMALSAAHYMAAEERDEETPAKRFGTAVHALTLGGELVVYDGVRQGNAWRAFRGIVEGRPYFVYDGAHNGKAWAAAKEAAEGRLIVTSADVEVASRAREIQARRELAGLRSSPIVTSFELERAEECAEAVRDGKAGWLLEGSREIPLCWELLGQACAGTLDVLHAERVVEVKTTACAKPEWFQWQARRMAYSAQLWWYREGARANGYDLEDCYIIAVETRPPYAVTPFRLTPGALEKGAKRVRLWMEHLIACTESGDWPDYVQTVVELDEPDEDVELDFGEAA